MYKIAERYEICILFDMENYYYCLINKKTYILPANNTHYKNYSMPNISTVMHLRHNTYAAAYRTIFPLKVIKRYKF